MERSPLSALQPEILVQIFHKLPLRTVSQCKLVCKEWCSLISNPFFKSTYNSSTIQDHPISLIMIPGSTANSHPNPALRYEIVGPGNPLVGRPQPLPCNFNVENAIIVLGSWNGLVALYRDGPEIFCLFNPFTGEKKHVHVDDEQEVNLWEDNLLGLCHDHVSGEYKAVLTISSFDGLSFYVVSFKQGNWKYKIQPEFQHLYCFENHPIGTIVQGVPHWICELFSNIFILYFDPQKEEFGMIRAPDPLGGNEIWGLGALDGQLRAFVTSVVDGRSVGGLEVWAMKYYGKDDSWSKMFVVENELGSFALVAWMKDDEILMDVNEEELMVYNFRNQSLRPLQQNMQRSSYSSMITYISSLVSPTQ